MSSKISNGSIILNVDCDMYSNNSESVRDAVCFFMDEEKGHEIAYVQFPQCYDNLTRNDLYDTCFRVINEVGTRKNAIIFITATLMEKIISYSFIIVFWNGW